MSASACMKAKDSRRPRGGPGRSKGRQTHHNAAQLVAGDAARSIRQPFQLPAASAEVHLCRACRPPLSGGEVPCTVKHSSEASGRACGAHRRAQLVTERRAAHLRRMTETACLPKRQRSPGEPRRAAVKKVYVRRFVRGARRQALLAVIRSKTRWNYFPCPVAEPCSTAEAIAWVRAGFSGRRFFSAALRLGHTGATAGAPSDGLQGPVMVCRELLGGCRPLF